MIRPLVKVRTLSVRVAAGEECAVLEGFVATRRDEESEASRAVATRRNPPEATEELFDLSCQSVRMLSDTSPWKA